MAGRHHTSVEGPEDEPRDETADRGGQAVVLVELAVEPVRPQQLQHGGSAVQHQHKADEERDVHVPASQRGRRALLAHRRAIARRHAVVQQPDRQQDQRVPSRLEDLAGALGGRRRIRKVVEPRPQGQRERVVQVDHEEDREDETRPVEVEMADRGRTLGDRPDREADDDCRAITCDGRTAELPFGVVEEEQDEGGAKARDSESDHDQRGGADQVDVEPAQDHARSVVMCPSVGA